MTRRPWTDHEKALILDGLLSIPEIAHQCNRSVPSVQGQVTLLRKAGLNVPSRRVDNVKYLELGREPGRRTPAQAANLLRAQTAAREAAARRRAAAGGEDCPVCGGVAGHPYKHGSSGYAHGCKCYECMEWMRENGRRKYAANREHIQKQAKARYNADPERHQQYQRDWRRVNLEQAKASHERSRQKRRAAGAILQDPRTKRRGNRRSRERLSLIPGPRNGLPWTPEEDAIVVQDTSLVAICYRVGRSYSAVRGRRHRLQKQRSP